MTAKQAKDFDIFNSRAIANEAGGFGGAISLQGGVTEGFAQRFVNSVFAHNVQHSSSGVGGGGFSAAGGSTNLTLTNCTLSNNSAAGNGGGLLTQLGADVTINNSVIWDNNSTSSGKQINVVTTGGTLMTIAFTDISQGPNDVVGYTVPTGQGNLNASPVFVDVDGGDNDPKTWKDNDYSLTNPSPCIDAGNNTLMVTDVPDLDGDSNTTEKTPLDVQRWLRRLEDGATGNTGLTDPTEMPPVAQIVDMGAHEGPRCLYENGCNDFDWCNVEVGCTTCQHQCRGRLFGDVMFFPNNAPYVSYVNIDDLLAVLSCFSGNCKNCGIPGSGFRSNCDLISGTSCPCTPDGVVNNDDILAVIAAMSGPHPTCAACTYCDQGPPQFGFGWGGEESAENMPGDVASQIFDFMAGPTIVEEFPEHTAWVLADVLLQWIEGDLTPDDRAKVVDELQGTVPQHQLAADLFAHMTAELSD